jgi:hypothetical protein
MEIGYHVSMLRGTNLVQQIQYRKMRHKRFVRKRACRRKGGKYGNLPGVCQTSMAMPEPATRGEELEGGSGGVRMGNRRAKGAWRFCIGRGPGSRLCMSSSWNQGARRHMRMFVCSPAKNFCLACKCHGWTAKAKSQWRNQ